MRQGTISISWGEYGGFYFHRGFSTRLCFGWMAFTYIPLEIDTILDKLTKVFKDFPQKK